MWENLEIDLGIIHANLAAVAIFRFIGPCDPQDVEVHAGCGCSPGVWNSTTKELTVMYTPSKVPAQVVGNQHVRKVTKMIYLCNGERYEDNLFFKAQVLNE